MNSFERGQFIDKNSNVRDEEVFQGKKSPRLLSVSDVSQILTGDPAVVFQVLDDAGEPLRAGAHFVVYIVWSRSFSRESPPIEVAHVPPPLWAAFASADGGWHHHESIHTNDLVHASVRIPAVTRLISASRGIVRITPEHTVRARTIMGMRLRWVLADGIGVVEGHLADADWQRHPFHFRVRLGKIVRKHSYQIFSDKLVQTVRDSTIFGGCGDMMRGAAE
jgi:hypothetical protein